MNIDTVTGVIYFCTACIQGFGGTCVPKINWGIVWAFIGGVTYLVGNGVVQCDILDWKPDWPTLGMILNC